MFRFTIRDLLWLMVVVAFGIAFSLEKWRGAVLQKHNEVLQMEHGYAARNFEALKLTLESNGYAVVASTSGYYLVPINAKTLQARDEAVQRMQNAK